MKKIICILTAVILCISSLTVSAADAIEIEFGDVAGTAGDVNVDTHINATDLSVLKKVLLKIIEAQSEKTADVNEDTKINICDLVRIKKLLAMTSPDNFTDYVKLLGRSTTVDSDGHTEVNMYWSYTGVTFEAYVTGDVTATIDSSGVWTRYAKLAVIVDGDTENRKIIEITPKVVKDYILTNVKPGVHTFEIVKVSEGPFGSMQLKSIDFLGYYTDCPPKADLTIEYVGDSITAGSGLAEYPANSTPEDQAHQLAVQDVLETYAFKSSKLLKADASIAGWSGIKTSAAAEKFFGSDSKYLSDEPDVTVIGLGTNDYQTEDTALSESVTAMLKTVREKYPNTKIVWVFGMMWTTKESVITAAVDSFNSTDGNTFYCRLPQNNGGGGSHPTAEGHTAAAEVLAEYIKETVLGN